MADQKVSQLPALLGANTAAGDLIYIVDTSEPLPADQSKSITLTEFQSAPVSAGTANGVLFLNGSKVVSSGSGLVFDSSGNLGLGVTPSAWNTINPALQVGNASFIGYNNQATLSANYFFSSGNKYISNGFATQYNQSSGQHIWYTAPSGTAGNAISFTQAMTLNASGQLSVGTTSASAKITIGGSGANRISFDAPSGSEYVGYDGADDALQVASYTYIKFQTGSSYTERARIPAAGGMVVGTAALATAATDGFLYVPTCAGAPTGTPTTQTGTAPIVVDTTNNKLYFYSGGQWRDAGP